MNYIEIVERQSVIEAEMMERQEELQALQQQRIAVAQAHEDLHVDHTLTSGSTVGIDLNYKGAETSIFTLNDGRNDSYASFSAEDYNEMSQFFSKYNDAIFSYMSEITKEDEVVAND